MKKKDNFENHRLRTLIWIVRLLQRFGRLTFEEINDEWVDNKDLSRGIRMERKTFFNHRRAVADLFGIDIDCNRKNGNKYEITYANKQDKVAYQMMDNFEQNLALGSASDLGDRIVVDSAPCGSQHLEKIMEAMRKSRNITIEFQDFGDEEPWTVTGSPYCVRLYQQRWYVVIKDLEEDDESSEPEVILPYSLDRIKHVRLEKTKFKLEKGFNAEEFFRYSFGVRVVLDEEPMMLKLKFVSQQCPYIRTLPLHRSQEEIETTPEYSIFSYKVTPTWELASKIMSYGQLVEVIEPLDYREVIKNEAKELYKKYFK